MKYVHPAARALAAEVREEEGLPVYMRDAGGNLARMEGLFRKAMEPDVPAYDIRAEQDADFDGWIYAEGMNALHVYTRSVEINTRLMLEAAAWAGTVDRSHCQHMRENLGDKWELVSMAGQTADKVIFLPGGNLDEIVDLDQVRRAALHDKTWMLKPHPVTLVDTLHQWVGRFGSQVYDPKASGMQILKAASVVGYTTTSELGIVAMAFGKQTRDFSVFELEPRGNYYPLYRAIRESDDPAVDVIDRLFACPWSGLVPFYVTDDEATDRFNQFKAKTVALRETYKPLVWRSHRLLNIPVPTDRDDRT